MHTLPDDEGYALYHSIGHRPGGADEMADAVASFARLWSAPRNDVWQVTLERMDRFRTAWARLVGPFARADEVALTPSVTSALFAIIDAMEEDRLRGRRVLIADDAFPSLHFLLQGLAARLGFEIRRVPLAPGGHVVGEAEFVAALADDVALVLVTWVSSTTSATIDLAAAARAAPADCLVVVDVTQGIGVLPLELPARVDAVVSTSLKWLCGIAGAGVLWVRSSSVDRLRPGFRGWFSQDRPMRWDLDAFAFADGARRFENGTPSPLPYVASLPGVEWVAGEGFELQHRHNRRLTVWLFKELARSDLEIVTPAPEHRRGGSVMIDVGSTERAGRTVQALADAGVIVDSRAAVVRVSPGLLTSEAGLQRCVEVLCASGRARSAGASS